MIDGSPRILIVRLSAIGDVVRVLPALHVLREAYPHAQIDWVVERKASAIIEDHPALDELLVFDRPAGFLKAARAFLALCRQVRRRKYDIAIDFHGILKSGVITGFSGAHERYGFARPRSREGSYLFTNHRVRLDRGPLNRIEENLCLCEKIAARRGWPNVTIYVPRDVQAHVDAFFDETFDGGKQVVAMHVPVDREEKSWPTDRFARVADMLLADGRFDVVLTYGPGQRDEARAVAQEARRNPVIAPEMPDLKHYAWLVHRAGLYFGCDTGPMHIASFMGTPVVAVFGGTNPAQHAPYRQPYEILYVEDAGDGSPRARLDAVTPEMAYDACVRLVSRVADEKRQGNAFPDEPPQGTP